VQATKSMQFVNPVVIVDKPWGISHHFEVSDFPSTSSSVVLLHPSSHTSASLSLCLVFCRVFASTISSLYFFSHSSLSNFSFGCKPLPFP